MKQVSIFFSWIFHPLLMVTYCVVIYFLLPSEFEYVDKSLPWKIAGLVFISTFLLPVFSTLALKRRGFISDLEMENKQERNWPLLQTAFLYAGAYYFVFDNKAIPDFIKIFLIGSILGILFSLLINLKWKISLHMIGIGGLCGGIFSLFIIHQYGIPFVPSLLFMLAGVLGTSRLYLSTHTPMQILAGFLLGFTVEFLLVFFLLPY